MHNDKTKGEKETRDETRGDKEMCDETRGDEEMCDDETEIDSAPCVIENDKECWSIRSLLGAKKERWPLAKKSTEETGRKI